MVTCLLPPDCIWISVKTRACVKGKSYHISRSLNHTQLPYPILRPAHGFRINMSEIDKIICFFATASHMFFLSTERYFLNFTRCEFSEYTRLYEFYCVYISDNTHFPAMHFIMFAWTDLHVAVKDRLYFACSYETHPIT